MSREHATPKNPTEFEALFAALYPSSPLPSKDNGRAWHYATAPGAAFHSTGISGKWCIFRSSADIDEAWQTVRQATESGQFLCAKVSTAASRGVRPSHLICVYTHDYTDNEDVGRAREALRALGFVEELGYKRDIDTFNGVYGEGEWYVRA